MMYIPDEWIVNKENKEKIFEIIRDTYYSDINLLSRIDDCIRRLREIGEYKIAEKIQNCEISRV